MTTKLKRGTDNPITIVYKNADGTARTGATLKFYLVDARFTTPETAPRIGEDLYDTTETATAGTYVGTFPMADSLELLAQCGRRYRIVPFEDGVFQGDDQSFEVQLA